MLVFIAFVALAQDSFKPPDDIDLARRTAVSEGTRIAVERFRPKAAEGQKLPTILMGHGWGGTAANLRPDAVAFARAGYCAVAFDYRGWGASDGRVVLTDPPAAQRPGGEFSGKVREIREVVDPIDQTTDWLNMVHWVAGEPGCDVSRLGIWGSSYSGGHVVYVAARDARVKALVSQVPALDSRWVLEGDQAAATFEEATKRARGELGYPKPGAVVIGNLRGAPIREKMMGYAPVEDAARAPSCAMLFILAENEELFDNRDHGIKAHERATGPKKLLVIPKITHYGVYLAARPQAQKAAIEWFDEHLK
jgi:dienelactone hydrolase